MFENAAMDGKQIRDVDWPEGALLIEIQRGERVIVPHGDTVIRLGDTLLNVTQKDLPAIRRKMKRLTGA